MGDLMYERRHTLLSAVVLVTLFGSVVIAFVDPAQRKEFMSIASSSLGAYWALQKPHAPKESGDEDECDS